MSSDEALRDDRQEDGEGEGQAGISFESYEGLGDEELTSTDDEAGSETGEPVEKAATETTGDTATSDEGQTATAEDDEEEASPKEEQEESLEEILAREQDLDIEVPEEEDNRRPEVSETDPVSQGEFICRSCFLVKRRAQLADDKEVLCVECA